MEATLETHSAHDIWAPRRQLSLEQARQRSDLVKLLRMLFLSGAAISIGILAGYLAANAIERAGSQRPSLSSDEIVTMLSPRFTGRSKDGDAYVIVAGSAQRHRDDPEKITLLSPTMNDEAGGLVSAPTGIYYQQTQTLELSKNVVLVNQSGYVFQTNRALVHMEDGRVEGLEPLTGSGPTGDISADSYEVTDEGTRIILRGHVKMTLYPDGRPENGGQ